MPVVVLIAEAKGSTVLLRPVYDATAGADGYVSLEVSPALAHDTAGTIAEARRLARELQELADAAQSLALQLEQPGDER